MQLLDILAQQYAIGRAAIIRAPYWDGTTDFLTGAAHIGNTEGPIEPEPNSERSTLTLPENTGPGILEEYETGSAPTFDFGIFPSPSALALFSATNSASAGNKRQRKTRKHTLWIVPEQLFIASDEETGVDEEVAVTYINGVWQKDGGAFSTEDTRLFNLSIFLWRVSFSRVMPAYRHEEAGKSLKTVEGMVLVDTTKPDGHMLWTIGADLAGSEIDLNGVTS